MVMPAPYDSARISPGVTIAIAGATGDITASHANLNGNYIITFATGQTGDTLAP
jgi:hypothetical protein